jgi:anaerobic selenocysteine-containing dehydrogenase
MRNPEWRKKDRGGALRMNPQDAERIGVADGARARLSTRRGSVEVSVEVSTACRAATSRYRTASAWTSPG